MAKANPYDPSDVSHSIDYTVKTKGDRWFIPINAPTAATADQLAQCQVISPSGAAKSSTNGTEVVST
jgi:hypothetical protein